MGRVWLWGAGNNFTKVKSCLFREVMAEGIIDGNEALAAKKEGLQIFFPYQELLSENDIIIITPQRYEDIQEEILGLYSEKKIRVVPFWDKKLDDDFITDIIDVQKRKMLMDILELESKIKYMNLVIQNAEFELTEKIVLNPPRLPQILSGEKALELAITEHRSMCRFGDGEFEIIFGRERPIFQKSDEDLKERLKEVLINKKSDVLTCIADNYGSLEKYNDMSAYAIRRYLTRETRKKHMEVIDLKKRYYDAYISRPYIIYKKKKRASYIFALWKKLWENRDVIIIEGELTRNGYGNDLFQDCRSIKRILCPTENAWNAYKDIYFFVQENIGRDKLLLISLGPTATVLAYDLAAIGFQAIDMGHLDNEYEWYIRGVDERVNISYKYVPECCNGTQVDELKDTAYENQILIHIACGKNEKRKG